MSRENANEGFESKQPLIVFRSVWKSLLYVLIQHVPHLENILEPKLLKKKILSSEEKCSLGKVLYSLFFNLF